MVMAGNKKKLAVFVSGTGTNCENIIRYFRRSERGEVALVLSTTTGCLALEKAQRLGVPTMFMSREDFLQNKEISYYYLSADTKNRNNRRKDTKTNANHKRNCMLDLIAEDPMFNLSREELEKTMDPSKYTGRASVQVDAFLKNVVQPVLEENREVLGMTAEINV